MDGLRFDAMTRSLSQGSSRRRFLHGLTAVLGLATAHVPGAIRAGRRKKKLKRNEFGCVDIGGKCRGKDGNCCSGICKGKKPKQGERDKSRCAVGGCRAGQDSCTNVLACKSSTGFSGRCFTTTSNTGYCGVGSACIACADDTECVPELGPGAACVICDPNTCGIGSVTLCKSPSPD
jgi:hypothetical protein